MKKIRKTLSVLLVVLMLLTSAPLQGLVGLELSEWFKLPTSTVASAVSETIIASGNCGANGDNVTWTLYDNGEIVISGQGNMANYSSETTPWYSYRMNISKVVIEEGVTSVGAYSFYCHSNVTEIFFPSSVTQIGNFAFISCSSLTEIILPDTIKTIGWGVFEGCSSVQSAKIGNGISYINGALFCNCKNLKEV